MVNHVAHFAIHADDVNRARAFYEGVFGWAFKPWGPPEFYLISTGPEGDDAIHGALQKRQIPVTGDGMIGYECTVSVADLDAITESVETHGGVVTMPKTEIPQVGSLIQFRDTEGNMACAMQYLER